MDSDRISIRQASLLTGRVDLPGDKSVAHRCALFAALGDGTSRIVHYPGAEDPWSTVTCVRALGADVQEEEPGILVVEGVGVDGLRAPASDLDCGNSGTTMRLLSGILAGQSFNSVLVGDESLQSRPMERIRAPLAQMGGGVRLTAGRAPIRIAGRNLRPITYRLPVASAQVKSCVLLAGLYADGVTTVIETEPSRDHTERMLGLDGVMLGSERHISLEGGLRIPARTWAVPADFSAAAFFLVASSIVPGSLVKLFGVGLNASRTGLLDVLRAMGADITVSNERVRGGEPIGDLTVRSAPLVGVEVGGSLIPNLIDEIPILAVAAACAEGTTVIRDAGELRVKETDRIAATAAGLRAIGADVTEQETGLTITGGRALTGAPVEARHDHRIAMSMAVAGLVASGETTIHGASVAAVSFPGFWDALKSITL